MCSSDLIRDLAGDPERFYALIVAQQSHRPGPFGAPHASVDSERDGETGSGQQIRPYRWIYVLAPSAISRRKAISPLLKGPAPIT